MEDKELFVIISSLNKRIEDLTDSNKKKDIEIFNLNKRLQDKDDLINLLNIKLSLYESIYDKENNQEPSKNQLKFKI